MPFIEDFSPFFEVAEFASAASLDGSDVQGIFDAPVADALGMGASQPAFILPTASVLADPVGRSLVVGEYVWRVVEHQPDGTGVSRLVLERAP